MGILVSDLDTRRYGLILRAVNLGLKELGITGIWCSDYEIDRGKFSFSVVRETYCLETYDEKEYEKD